MKKTAFVSLLFLFLGLLSFGTLVTLIVERYSILQDTPKIEVILPEGADSAKAGDKFVVDIVSKGKIYLEFDKHYCDWEDCSHQGEVRNQMNFKSKWNGGYAVLTDGWCVEMTHFINPTWSYQQCEDYVMSGVE